MRFIVSIAISPIHTSGMFPNGYSLEDKIEVFIARVRGWQIQPALDLRENNVPHRGFAQLLIISSYFEMIGKYRAGYIGFDHSRHFFKEGLIYTFPDIPFDSEVLITKFYQGVRNGLYHAGMTMPNVYIVDDIPGSFGFQEESHALMISPDRFIDDISIRFDNFAHELRNHKNDELRNNFEIRFDSDNGLID